VYKIDADSQYNAERRSNAFQKAQEWGDKIPIGVIYRNQRPTLEEQIPAITDKPLVAQPIDPGAFSELLETFK
jgi:2-oxoglutarate ferredoxin oxidoreductase subunit beta